MKRVSVLALFAVLLVALAGCAPGATIQITTPDSKTPAKNSGSPAIQVYAPGPNSQINTPGALGYIASLPLGLWHGFISPVTLVISFFNPEVQMYEVHNDGAPYNLGFFLGMAFLLILVVLTGNRRR